MGTKYIPRYENYSRHITLTDLTLMNHIKLHPLPSNRVADMWSEEELPEDYWENFLKDSLQLHTSSSHTNVFLVQGKDYKDRSQWKKIIENLAIDA